MPFFKQGQTNLERQTILSLFIKVMKKFYKYLDGLASKEIESTLPRLKEVSFLMTIYLCVFHGMVLSLEFIENFG